MGLSTEVGVEIIDLDVCWRVHTPDAGVMRLKRVGPNSRKSAT
jgi:hypothetical protein